MQVGNNLKQLCTGHKIAPPVQKVQTECKGDQLPDDHCLDTWAAQGPTEHACKSNEMLMQVSTGKVCRSLTHRASNHNSPFRDTTHKGIALMCAIAAYRPPAAAGAVRTFAFDVYNATSELKCIDLTKLSALLQCHQRIDACFICTSRACDL